MVLDAKALSWAAKHEIDTAKLKKAKLPIYGKWYFPEIPPNVALINLETGEQEIFPERMIAGEVIYVPAAELQAAGLAPGGFTVMTAHGEAATTAEPQTRAIRAVPPEPLIAMVRPPGLPHETTALVMAEPEVANERPPELIGIHTPLPSVAPFVLAIGFCLVFLGLITNVVILVTGLLWMCVGAIVWVRIGLLEYRSAHAHAEVEDAT
jgi:hypothetical protein